MLRDKLQIFDVTLDDNYSENGEYLGIDRISNVANPAVKIKGVAFSDHTAKKVFFADDKKYRLVAPVLVPGTIYRNDDDGEYSLRFTPEIIETIAKKLMRDLHKFAATLFSSEHNDSDLVDSYILEAILVDSESKVKMIKDSYGLVVPLGSFIVVQQFNDKDRYNEVVSKGQTGLSIEGFLGMMLPTDVSNKQKFNKMSKKKKFVGVKRTFKTASKKKLEEVIETSELVLIADDLKEGEEVIVVEEGTDGVPSANKAFNGEIDTVIDGVDQVIIIEDGMITEVVEEEVVAPVEEVAMVDEPVVEEVLMADEVVETVETVVETPTETSDYEAKFTEIYEMIAEIKKELSDMKELSDIEEVAVEMSRKNFSVALDSFNKWNNK